MKHAMLILAAGMLAGSGALASDEGTLTTSKGQVVSSDASTQTLIVKVQQLSGDEVEMTFVLNDESKIVKGSSKLALADVAGGDKVVVNYRTIGGKNLVLSIGVEPQA